MEGTPKLPPSPVASLPRSDPGGGRHGCAARGLPRGSERHAGSHSELTGRGVFRSLPKEPLLGDPRTQKQKNNNKKTKKSFLESGVKDAESMPVPPPPVPRVAPCGWLAWLPVIRRSAEKEVSPNSSRFKTRISIAGCLLKKELRAVQTCVRTSRDSSSCRGCYRKQAHVQRRISESFSHAVMLCMRAPLYVFYVKTNGTMLGRCTTNFSQF